MNSCKIAAAGLLLTACSTPQGPDHISPKAVTTPTNMDCFADAAAATNQQYSTHFKSDWYVKLRAVVQASQVQSIDVNVGPYDGSAGGGVAARYDCAEGQLVTLEYER